MFVVRAASSMSRRLRGRQAAPQRPIVGLNNMSGRWRQFVKRLHPEGIPWPGVLVYNALSSTKIFLRHYELVARDMPKAICDDVRAQFGGFRLALLWLHSFEEPFLDVEELVALGKRTAFLLEGTRFTGALCCLVLRKAGAPTGNTDMEGQSGPRGLTQ